MGARLSSTWWKWRTRSHTGWWLQSWPSPGDSLNRQEHHQAEKGLGFAVTGAKQQQGGAGASGPKASQAERFPQTPIAQHAAVDLG